MVNYVRIAATAKRLIEANGRNVTLIRKSRTPANASEPWRGPTSPGDATVGVVKAIIYPVREEEIDGFLIKAGMEKATIAHDSLATPQDLRDIDAIIDATVTYKVVKAVVIGPGGTNLVYEFFLER